VARLPIYHRVLGQLLDDDVATVSSAELAELTGVNSAKVRKDLSHLGSYGVRGVGYDVAYLNYQISRGLGLTNDAAVLIVGAGNLGRALASRGLRQPRVPGGRPADTGLRSAAMGRSDQRSAQLEDRPHRARHRRGSTPQRHLGCDRLVAAGVTAS
jgi:redox-sensing transcriptional repressor